MSSQRHTQTTEGCGGWSVRRECTWASQKQLNSLWNCSNSSIGRNVKTVYLVVRTAFSPAAPRPVSRPSSEEEKEESPAVRLERRERTSSWRRGQPMPRTWTQKKRQEEARRTRTSRKPHAGISAPSVRLGCACPPARRPPFPRFRGGVLFPTRLPPPSPRNAEGQTPWIPPRGLE